MIGEAIAAFLGGVAGSTVGARAALGAWPWVRPRAVKPADAGPAVPPVPRPAVMQYRPPAPAAPDGTVWITELDLGTTPIPPTVKVDASAMKPVDIGEVVQLEIDTAQSLTLEERNRKWAERRRRAEAAPKPVGL